MEGNIVINNFSGTFLFLKDFLDSIVPLLSILGTAMVALYTICAVLTKANLHDKTKGLRGHNPKIIDYDLIVYLIIFLCIAISAFFARNSVSLGDIVKFILITSFLSYFLVVNKAIEVIVGKIIDYLKKMGKVHDKKRDIIEYRGKKTLKEKIEKIIDDIKEEKKKKEKESRGNVRVFKIAFSFAFFGVLIGYFFIEDMWAFALVILFFILFLTKMDTIFLHEDDKNNSIVEIGIIEDGGITLVSGIICFENESEIFFEIEETKVKEASEEEVSKEKAKAKEEEVKSQSYIYRYNKSDIKYIRKKTYN